MVAEMAVPMVMVRATVVVQDRTQWGQVEHWIGTGIPVF